MISISAKSHDNTKPLVDRDGDASSIVERSRSTCECVGGSSFQNGNLETYKD